MTTKDLGPLSTGDLSAPSSALRSAA
jgi:hypothetical protein